MKFKVGDEIVGWGFQMPYEFTTPGVVDRVYEQEGKNYVDWHNEFAWYAAWEEGYMKRPSEIRVRGLERVL